MLSIRKLYFSSVPKQINEFVIVLTSRQNLTVALLKPHWQCNFRVYRCVRLPASHRVNADHWQQHIEKVFSAVAYRNVTVLSMLQANAHHQRPIICEQLCNRAHKERKPSKWWRLSGWHTINTNTLRISAAFFATGEEKNTLSKSKYVHALRLKVHSTMYLGWKCYRHGPTTQQYLSTSIELLRTNCRNTHIFRSQTRKIWQAFMDFHVKLFGSK